MGNPSSLTDLIVGPQAPTHGLLGLQRLTPDRARELRAQIERERAAPFALECGFPSIQDVTRGLRRLCVLGAAPATGKSTLCAIWTAEALRNGHHVVYLCVEEAASSVFDRIERAAGGPKAIDELLSAAGLYLLDSPDAYGLDLPETEPASLAGQVRQLVSESGSVYFFADSLNAAESLIPLPDERGRLLTVMTRLRAVADIPGVAGGVVVSFLNRKSIQEARPSMEGLFGAQAIAHTADRVLIAQKAYIRDLHSGAGTEYRCADLQASVPLTAHAVRLFLAKNRFGLSSVFSTAWLDGKSCRLFPDSIQDSSVVWGELPASK